MQINDSINRYKIWNPETRRNPQALYARMRDEAPVYCAIGPVSGNRFWFLTRYEDCSAALRDPRFGKVERKSKTASELAALPPVAEMMTLIDSHMLNSDPPAHTRLRGLVHKVFSPAMIESLRARTQQVAEELLDGLAANESQRVDLIDGYAFPLPIIVIAEMLGIATDDRHRFRDWSKTILYTQDMGERARAAGELLHYLQPVFAQRRLSPQDDLISALLAVEDEGDRLRPYELSSMVFLLLVAGHETTVNLIGNGTLALLQHPGEIARLRSDPGLIKPAVEEMLRYNGPVENTLARWAYEDVTWGGQLIRRGDIVMATLAAANRDPAVFADGDRFDVTRSPNRHIAFGAGIHYCLGAPLARLEGAIALEALFQRFPRLSLAVPSEDLLWSSSILLHGLVELPASVA